jgi:hypothetical protein
MAKRPRSTRISNQSDVLHLVALTHDDENMVTTLCGYKTWGVDSSNAKLPEAFYLSQMMAFVVIASRPLDRSREVACLSKIGPHGPPSSEPSSS